MPLLILMTLLLLMNWLFSETFILIPLSLLDSLKPLTNLALMFALLAFLWYFCE